ncbi:MAG: S8 family serine peptidase, partial [Proteobacteria bacterium]|nr:S8 family serine peptidase [Pseudomonadota bacterium]
ALKRWFKTDEKPREHAHHHKPREHEREHGRKPEVAETVTPSVVPAPAPAAATQPQKKVTAAPMPSLANVKFGDTSTNEILAVNPSDELLKRAAALKFSIEPAIAIGSLDATVQRLLPPAGMDPAAARDLLSREADKSKLESNLVYRPYRPQADEKPQTRPPSEINPETSPACSGDRCYGRKSIRWSVALNRCTSGVRIGLIDTAVDLAHPSLKSSEIYARSFRRGPLSKHPVRHGTSTLAILAGAPGSPVAGLLPFSPYYVADIFFADERGEPASDTLSMLLALDWMRDSGVRVVNMSIAGPHDPLMERAINKLAKKGMIFVAAAGNNGADGPALYPAAYGNVIAVSAVARDLRSYAHANRGGHIDLVAPGV